MYRTIDLGKPAPIEHNAILERWRWFRAHLESIHGVQDLPASFTEDEGQIAVVERVMEEDPNFDLQAAEFNYGSRTQTLLFLQERCFASVHVSRTDIGDYFRFEFSTVDEPPEVVRYVGTERDCRLDLDDESPHFQAWTAAAAAHRSVAT